jgi:hypothetical protein
MKWVTRKRIRVNRAATAWFIRRFIDPAAELIFVAPEEVRSVQEKTGALGFDAPGATYPHEDEKGRCSFEALIAEHRPNDQVLAQMARIVHGADFDKLDFTPESAGLCAISYGFPLVAKDDEETVAKSAFLYDALYASLSEES